MKNSKTISLFVLMTVVILLVSACSSPAEASQEATSTASAVIDPAQIIAEGRLEPIRYAEIAFNLSGVVSEVLVQDGEVVEKGQTLIRLGGGSDPDYTAAQFELVEAQQAFDVLNRTGAANLAATWTAYMDAQEARAEAQRDWEDLNIDNLDEQIDDAKTELEDRTADLQDAQDEFDKYKDLDTDNSKRKTAEDELERAQNEYNEAVRKLEEVTRERDMVRAALDAALAAEAETKHQYELSTNGVNADQLVLARARLENAKAGVATFTVVAPFDGVVAELNAKAGGSNNAGEIVVTVADFSSWIVKTTDLMEIDVVNLAETQPVVLTLDAIPNQELKGTILSIGQTYSENQGDVVYEVTILLTDKDPAMRWGMTAEVKFEQ